MKRLFCTLLVLLPLGIQAQNIPLITKRDSVTTVYERIAEKPKEVKSHINLEFVSSANAYFTNNNYDEFSFKTNRVRLEILGQLNDQLSYHFRQSFNRYHNPNAVDNLPSSIEYAYMKWKKDKFEIIGGKQFVALSGYEGYVNGIIRQVVFPIDTPSMIRGAHLLGDLVRTVPAIQADCTPTEHAAEMVMQALAQHS